MKNRLILTSALLASLALTACGSVSATLTGAAGNLSTLAANTASTLSSEVPADGRMGPGGKRGSGDRSGFGMLGLPGIGRLDQLNLSDDQKTQLQALQTEARTFMESNRPTSASQTDPAALKAAFEAAFKADTLDTSKLASLHPTRPAPDDTQIAFQVSQLVKLHDILTADQRNQLFATPSKAPDAMASPPADARNRETARIDQMASALSLTDAQKTQLQAIFTAEQTSRQSEIAAGKTRMEADRSALQAIFTATTIDQSALTSWITSHAPKAADADAHLAVLVQIHDLLTAEQRVQFLSLAPQNQQGDGRGGHGHGPDGFGPAGPMPAAAPAASITAR